MSEFFDQFFWPKDRCVFWIMDSVVQKFGGRLFYQVEGSYFWQSSSNLRNSEPRAGIIIVT